MIFEPHHDVCYCSGNRAKRCGRAVYHDDRQTKGASGVEFSAGTCAACILCDDMGDGMIAQECDVGIFGEWAFGDNYCVVRQGDWGFRFVDETQEVVVLRFDGEGLKGLLADSKENAGGFVGESVNGCFEIRNVDPAIGGGGAPWWAFEGDERGLRFFAGGDNVAAYARSEGVCGVNDVGYRFDLQIVFETFGASKTADSGGKGLGNRCVGASGVGEDCVKAFGRKLAGQQASFGCAAKKKDARHG